MDVGRSGKNHEDNFKQDINSDDLKNKSKIILTDTIESKLDGAQLMELSVVVRRVFFFVVVVVSKSRSNHVPTHLISPV